MTEPMFSIENKEWEVPPFTIKEFFGKSAQHCACIPVLNEGSRIQNQLKKMKDLGIPPIIDIVIADGGSTDNALDEQFLRTIGARALLTLQGQPGLSIQMRMAMAYGLQENYQGLIFLDGNDKDDTSIIVQFMKALDEGYDHIGASRFMEGGKDVNTPLLRKIPMRLIHVPLLSWAAGYHYTDTTYGFRGYSRALLLDSKIKPLRKVFKDYELHYYLALKAARLGYRIKEIPGTRSYPKKQKIPTKISFIKGNILILKNLIKTCLNRYDPEEK